MIEYDSIGKNVVIRVSTDALARRDKISLLVDLMRETGVLHAILKSGSEGVQQAIDTYLDAQT